MRLAWIVLANLLGPHSRTEAAMTQVTEESTRDETLTALVNVNTTAKSISRRGYIGLNSDEYKRRHEDINRLLTELYPEPLP